MLSLSLNAQDNRACLSWLYRDSVPYGDMQGAASATPVMSPTKTCALEECSAHLDIVVDALIGVDLGVILKKK